MMGFGFLKKLHSGYQVVGRIRKAIDEGRDVKAAIEKIESKYEDLDDDLKEAWREVKEFTDAVSDIF
jgi:arginyl-tRNA synthetase